MGKITRPRIKIVKFGREDIIATSGIFTIHVNEMFSNWYLIQNGEGAKGFVDWYSYASHNAYDSDTLVLTEFEGGDWYNANPPGGSNVADQNNPAHTSLVYIWYNSGYGWGNVTFNTEGKDWSYYLDNNLPLPRSN